VTKFAKKNGHIQIAHLLNTQTGEEFRVEAEQVVNAAGAWVDEVAALAGASIDMVYSKGTLLVTHTRITKRAIIRLRWPADADAVMPGGTVSVIGPTSVRLNSLEGIRPTVEEVDFVVEDAAGMLPVLETTRYVRAFSGVRPLIASKSPEGDDHSLSRGFALLDHSHAGLKNFITITGGKLSTYRVMAERTADLVCERLGVTTPCKTRTEILPRAQDCKWTEPGLSPRLWIKQHNPEDILLCECEMVPKSAVDSIIETLHKQKTKPSLRAIGLRSRIGKGSCQGAFCSVRVAGYLYSRGELERDEGLALLRDFVRERWKGQRPVLWGEQLMQAELSEAVHCGLLGLEL
jgi:glycerol-3-phosphate dehydrogenase